MAKKSNRVGRPRFDKGEFDNLNIRVSKERKARWKKAADKAGISVSEFVRRAADELSERL